MKMIDHLCKEARTISHPLQLAIQKNVLVNISVKCDFDSGFSYILQEAIFDILEDNGAND